MADSRDDRFLRIADRYLRDILGSIVERLNAIDVSGAALVIPAGAIRAVQLAAGVASANLGFTPENAAKKNAANGYAGLDASTKLLAAQIPMTSSQSANGYVKLPDGTIVQWGSASVPSSNAAITFPIAFPTACQSVTMTHAGSVGDYPASVVSKSTTGFTAHNNSATYTEYWLAIGY